MEVALSFRDPHSAEELLEFPDLGCADVRGPKGIRTVRGTMGLLVPMDKVNKNEQVFKADAKVEESDRADFPEGSLNNA